MSVRPHSAEQHPFKNQYQHAEEPTDGQARKGQNGKQKNGSRNRRVRPRQQIEPKRKKEEGKHRQSRAQRFPENTIRITNERRVVSQASIHFYDFSPRKLERRVSKPRRARSH